MRNTDQDRFTLLMGCLLLWAPMSLPLNAQVAEIANGTLTVSEGTRMTFLAPIDLTVGSGGAIVNNGLIEVGAGRIIEPVGSPITGTGTETALTALPVGAFDVEPGGLGLRLSGTADMDTLFVERGHQPVVVSGTINSVARWFELRSAGPSDGPVNVSMRIDPSELNGISTELLELHRATTFQGPWAPIDGTVDQDLTTVSAEITLDGLFLTAFQQDVMTGSASDIAVDQFRVWPTVTNERVNLSSAGNSPIRTVEVFDLRGGRVHEEVLASRSSAWSMNVELLEAGIYVMRVNGMFNLRFIRP
jgi:hypothetical protein